MSKARSRPWPGMHLLAAALSVQGAQAQLSRDTGIDEASLSRLKTGQQAPTIEQLRALAQALGVSGDELLGLRVIEEPDSRVMRGEIGSDVREVLIRARKIISAHREELGVLSSDIAVLLDIATKNERRVASIES